jgi:hypothetical protein
MNTVHSAYRYTTIVEFTRLGTAYGPTPTYDKPLVIHDVEFASNMIQRLPRSNIILDLFATFTRSINHNQDIRCCKLVYIIVR